MENLTLESIHVTLKEQSQIISELKDLLIKWDNALEKKYPDAFTSAQQQETEEDLLGSIK